MNDRPRQVSTGLGGPAPVSPAQRDSISPQRSDGHSIFVKELRRSQGEAWENNCGRIYSNPSQRGYRREDNGTSPKGGYATKPSTDSRGESGLVHCGPFANIAHGNSSIIADELALSDQTTCHGSRFGAEMGRKALHIKSLASGISPSCIVPMSRSGR